MKKEKRIGDLIISFTNKFFEIINRYLVSNLKMY